MARTTKKSRTGAVRTEGEITGAQGRAEVWGMGSPFGCAIPGIESTKGDYKTYRAMRSDPTIALARAAGTCAIKAADFSIQADDDAPKDAVQFIEDAVFPLWRTFVKDAMYARDYGWAGFEKLWEDRDGFLTIARMKPLRPDGYKILVDHRGDVVGLKAGEKSLWSDEAFVYTYDGECGDPYGRSIYENIRKHAWEPWLAIQKQNATYFAKAAGVISMVQYPAGKSRDEHGSQIDNAEIAKRILTNLQSSRGVIIPWELQSWAQDMARRGVDPEKIMAWQIKFLETASGHGEEFLGSMRYYDSLKCRGLLMPERAMVEGQKGTKAEAEEHGDLGIKIQELELQDLWGQFNKGFIDDIMSANYGPDTKGKVYGVPAKLVDADKALVRQIMTAVLTNAQNLDLFYSATDLDAALDSIGWPKSTENIEAPPVNNPQIPPDPANPNPPAPEKPAPAVPSETRLSRLVSDTFRTGLGIGKPSKTTAKRAARY